jgi:hypothetical protein
MTMFTVAWVYEPILIILKIWHLEKDTNIDSFSETEAAAKIKRCSFSESEEPASSIDAG